MLNKLFCFNLHCRQTLNKAIRIKSSIYVANSIEHNTAKRPQFMHDDIK